MFLNCFSAPPLNLANSPSLHLLTPAEQALCSQLRILPKPYLVIKETLVREYARRGGKLRRREARDLVKIDVNKTSRVWDFLVQSGYLKITNDQTAASSVTPSVSQSQDAKYVDKLRELGGFLLIINTVVPPWLGHLRKLNKLECHGHPRLPQCLLLQVVKMVLCIVLFRPWLNHGHDL